MRGAVSAKYTPDFKHLAQDKCQTSHFSIDDILKWYFGHTGLNKMYQVNVIFPGSFHFSEAPGQSLVLSVSIGQRRSGGTSWQEPC